MLPVKKNSTSRIFPGQFPINRSTIISSIIFLISIACLLTYLPGATRPPSGNLVHSQAYVSPQRWINKNNPDYRCDYLVPVNIVRIYSDLHGAEQIAPKKWLYTQVEVANQLFRLSDREMQAYKAGYPAPCIQFQINNIFDIHEREVSEILGKELDTESLFGAPRVLNIRQKASTKDLRSLKVTGATDYLTIYCVWSLRDPDEFVNEFGGESNVGFADRPTTGPRHILTRVTSARAIMGVVIARQEKSWMSTLAHELGHYFSLPHAWDRDHNQRIGITDLGTGPQGKVDPDPWYANVMDYDNGSQVIQYFTKTQLNAMYQFLLQRATRFITAKKTGGSGGSGGQPPVIATHEPTAQIHGLWIDRPVIGGQVNVHLKCNVNNMLNNEGNAVAWFYDSNGQKLTDSDGQYRSTDGQVSVGAPFKPGYEKTLYNDLELTLPAGQLHLLPGKHRIGVIVGLFKGSELLASSKQSYFDYQVPEAPKVVSGGQPAAWITNTKVSPAIVYQGKKWVRISAWLTVDNLLGKNIRLQARFYFSDGTPIRDFDGSYRSLEGLVMGENECVPKYPRTDLSDWQVWVPYDQLHLAAGSYSLATRLTVVYNGRALASRNSKTFKVSLQAKKWDLESSNGASTGSAQVQSVWVTHNHRYGTDIGLHVHARLNITGYQNVPCTVVAWFYSADGRVLQDFDRYYTTSDGQVSASTSITPIYPSANFNDVVIYIPYRQLHLGKGVQKLGVKVGVFQGATNLATQQNLVFFNVTW